MGNRDNRSCNGDVIRSPFVCCNTGCGCGRGHDHDDEDDDDDHEDDDDDCCGDRHGGCCDDDEDRAQSQLSFAASLLSISSVTEWLGPPGLDGAATSTPRSLVMSVSGELSQLRIQQNTVSTDTTPVIYTVFKNGLATRLTVTVAGNVASGKDTRHHVRVRRGDLITLQAVHGAFPSTVAVGNVIASLALSSGDDR